MTKSTPVSEVLKSRSSVNADKPTDNIVAEIINEIQRSESGTQSVVPLQKPEQQMVPVAKPSALKKKKLKREVVEESEEETESTESEESVEEKPKKTKSILKSSKKLSKNLSKNLNKKSKNKKKVRFLDETDVQEGDLEESPTLIQKVTKMFTTNVKDPAIIAVLVLLFTLPAMDNVLSTYLSFLSNDGKLSWMGLGVKAVLAGVLFLIIKKFL